MRRLTLIFAALLAILTTSCRHKELCYDHSHITEVDVRFIWNEELTTEPKSISVYFFPKDGGAPLRFEFTDCNGGRIRLERGRYSAICMNSDTRNIRIRNLSDFDTFCISTKDATSLFGISKYGITPNDVPKAKNTEDERFALSPETIWSGSLTDINIVEQGNIVTFHPERRTATFTVEIRNVQNLKWVNGVSGTIASMSGGHNAGRCCLSEERVTIPFEAVMHREESMITGGFESFGHCPTENLTHNLIIYAVLADQSQWYYTFDVTDQIHNAIDPYNIHILLEDLPFPKPVVNGGGFKPSVDEWNSVEINIQM